MIYRAIIIDDEQDSIDLLKIYLKKYCPKIEACSSATNVEDGIKLYYEEDPDIMFLDIELRDENSFEIIESISDLNCEIIFVSSYEQYALNAISYNITGYVLKPIEAKSLTKNVNKAIESIELKKHIESLEDEKLKNIVKTSSLIAIPSSTKIELLRSSDIIYAQADGRYTVFHLVNGESKVTTCNIGEYEKKLNPTEFVRIHHSYMVNLNMVKRIDVVGGYYCEMLNNKSLPIAKRKRDKLQRILKLK
jgi:two-component system LytT family response regulator